MGFLLKVPRVPPNNRTKSHPSTRNGSLSPSALNFMCVTSKTAKSGFEHFESFSTRDPLLEDPETLQISKSRCNLDSCTGWATSDERIGCNRPSKSTDDYARTAGRIFLKSRQQLYLDFTFPYYRRRLPVRRQSPRRRDSPATDADSRVQRTNRWSPDDAQITVDTFRY